MGAPVDHRPPPRPGVPWSPPEWPRLQALYLTVAALIVVAAAAGGWALRAADHALPPTLAPIAATVGPATVTVAEGWILETPKTTIGDASAEFSPLPGLHARAIVAFGATEHPSLVPAELRARLRDPLPAPRRTRLAGAPAWSYPPSPLEGGGSMEVTVAPTTRGVLTVACVAARGESIAVQGCATGIRQVTLAGAGAVTPAPDVALRARAPAVIERLDARRTELRPRLARATTPRGQARFATRLGHAYARAAATLRPLAPERGASTRVVALLTRAERSHGRLAAAARARWPKRHRMARRSVKAAEGALQRALANLG